MRGKFAFTVLAAAAFVVGCSKAAPATAPGASAAPAERKEGGPPPGAKLLYPAPQDVAAQIAAAGLYQMKASSENYHLHMHLEVYKGAQQVIVPGGIGVAPDNSFVSPLHTHTPSGVIHVEAPDPRAITLGQFFTLWGVPLEGAEVIVDDERVADPAAVVFRDYQLITVRLPG